LRPGAGSAGPARGEAEHATDRGESATRRQRTGEGVGGGRLGQQGFDLAGVSGGLRAEGGHQPATAGGQHGRAARAGGAGLRGARARRKAGGEAGEGALQTACGVGEVGPEREDQGGVERVAQEATGDEGGEARQDGAEPVGEVGSEGEGGTGGHGNYS